MGLGYVKIKFLGYRDIRKEMRDKDRRRRIREKGQGYLFWMGSLRRVGKRLFEDREEIDTVYRKIEVYKGKR